MKDIPTKDLEYIAAGQMDKVSAATLEKLAQSEDQSVFNPKVPYSGAAETARAAFRGATFGFGDEIEAGVRSMFEDRPYREIRDQLRAQQNQFRADMPQVATPTEIGSSIATPMGLMGMFGSKLPAGYQALIASNRPVEQVVRGGVAGGGAGALTALGEANEISGSGGNMLESGVKSGAVGAGVPLVLKGSGAMIRGVLNGLGVGDQSDAAYRIIANRLQKDDLTPDEALAALDDLRKAGVPNVVIADLGKNLQDLAYRAYVVPSGAKNQTLRFLESRLIDQPSEIVRGLADKAGLNKNVNGYEYLQGLAENQRLAAQAAYPKAYSIEVPAAPFQKFVNRPVFQQAYKEAQKRASAYGQPLPSFDALVVDKSIPTLLAPAKTIPTDVLHQMKIGLDRLIEAETDKVTGKVTGFGRDLTIVKNEFNETIKSLNPQYAKANAEFADSSRLQDAFSTGQGYQKLDTKEALDKLKKMNPAEKEAFRLGLMADINQRLENFKGGDFVRQIFKSDKQKSLLRYAFDDQKKYDEFVKYVNGLESQSKTAKNILGNSRTDERITVGQNTDDYAALAQAAVSGNPTNIALSVLRSTASRARGISGETSEALQKRLFTVDPVEQTAILNELRRRTQGKPLNLTSGAAGLGAATGFFGN